MAQEKTILESIREYLTTCPVFSGSVIHKDYLPDGEGYSVNTAKGEPVYKKYADGKVLKQYWFTVTMKALDTEAVRLTASGTASIWRNGSRSRARMEAFRKWKESRRSESTR